MKQIDLLKETVKFHTPTEEEEGINYEIVNYNEVTGRVMIKAINLGDEYLQPIQTVQLAELCKA